MENLCVSKQNEKSRMYVVTPYDGEYLVDEMSPPVHGLRPPDALASADPDIEIKLKKY